MENGNEIIDRVDQSEVVVEALVRGEIDIQISTARKYPRSVTQFRRQATALACLDSRTASECLYSLRRAGKTIEGPSVRLAEIVASSYGNLRVQARIVSEGATHVTASAVAFDLQNNVAISSEVRRRITTADGRRYSDDMIAVTCNAACAIALRNSVFSAVPRALWRTVEDEVRRTIAGDQQTLSTRRRELLGWFAGQGRSQEQVLRAIGVRGIEDVGADEFIRLSGIRTAVETGEATMDTALGGSNGVTPPAAAQSVATKLAEKAKPKPKPKAKPKAKPTAKPAEAEADGPPAEPKIHSELPAWRLLCREHANRSQTTMGEASQALANWCEANLPAVQPATMTDLSSEHYAAIRDGVNGVSSPDA